MAMNSSQLDVKSISCHYILSGIHVVCAEDRTKRHSRMALREGLERPHPTIVDPYTLGSIERTELPYRKTNRRLRKMKRWMSATG